MKILNDFYGHISAFINVDVKYITLILNTVLLFVILSFFSKMGKILIKKFISEERKTYIYNQNYTILLNILKIVFLMFIWDTYIKNLMTFISFISAAFAIALRDIILNFFCGIYIKIKKTFQIEDRIEINDIKGDVMNISSLEFSILEINNKENNGQSTGVIVTFPNSIIFSTSIKNLTKGFKYIWNEMVIKVPFDCDLESTKKELYQIVNNNEIIKMIPKKMAKQLNNINDKFRVYFNKYDPMIYTKITDECIALTIRYLIHPKKARYVESVIYNNILTAYKNKKIELYHNV